MSKVYVYIVLFLSHAQSSATHEDINMFATACFYLLQTGEIYHTRIGNFCNPAGKRETGKISVWHHTKEKNREDPSHQVVKDQQNSPKIKSNENALKETFEAKKKEGRANL